MNMKRILILCAAITLVAVNVFADTITFKSGKKVEGDITSITNDSVTVNIYGVTEMTYDIGDIQEINGQVVELKPSATAPAATSETPVNPPAETPVNPPAETTQAAPEASVPPPKTVETAPVINEVAPGVRPPTTESMTPPTGEGEEKIPGFPAGGTAKMNMSEKEAMAILSTLKAFFGIILILFLILYIYSAICLQTIATKTGAENGWMAWIPIANLFLMCNIGYVRYLWLLLLLAGFVPILGTILGPLCDLFLSGFLWYRIALARGKQGWIGAITVIPVVGLFTMGYLAFSKKEEEAAPVLPDIGGGQPAKPPETASSFKPPLE